MEVRLSEFAAIVGTRVDTIRNAIRQNKLPFLDANRQNAETKDKLARRTYSASDAFGWFLQDRISTALGFGAWGSAGRVQSAWPRGLSWYARDRLAGEPMSEFYLIFAEGLPSVDGVISSSLDRASHSVVGDAGFVDDLRSKYTFVTAIKLDSVFDLFLRVTKSRGWTVSEDGFAEADGNEATRARMLARERAMGLASEP